jgi:thiol-disulfide isomerase/thioredoxin
MGNPAKHKSGLWVLLLIGVLIGVALALIVLHGFPDEASPSSSRPLATAGMGAASLSAGTAPEIGARAPNFILQDLNGLLLELDDFGEKVVLLNFWATWCGPCRLEMPLLERYYQELADQGFVILAINLGESAEEVEAFMDELGLTFPALLDPDGNVSELYRVIGYPTSVLIDTQGSIQAIHIGILSELQLDKYLSQVGLSG